MIRRCSCTGFLAFCLLLFVSCGHQPAIVDEYIQIPDRDWDYDFKPEAEIKVEEVRGPYTVYINLRHTQHYRFSNLFLLLQQRLILPNGLSAGVPGEPHRVELTLAAPDGRWLGKQSGNIYSYRHLVTDQYFFPDTGIYKLSLEQNMRENPLEGVVAAGLRIELTAGQ